MTTPTTLLSLKRVGTTQKDYPPSNFRWDMSVIALGGWLLGGLYIDQWAHNYLTEIETFFTPWHAAFYSGFFAVGLFLVGHMVRHWRQGYPLRRALPQGYFLSLVGLFIFAVGGALDIVWHGLFGFEFAFEAVLSPPHLLLGVGMVLILAGPFRAAWARVPADGATWRTLTPAIVSILFVQSICMGITTQMHPFAVVLAGRTDVIAHVLGVASVIIQSALFMGPILLMARRWALPFGTVTFLFAANTLLLSFMHQQWPWLAVAVVAGLAADGLLRLLRVTPARRGALRLFAILTPIILFGLYFGVIAATGGLAWSVHLTTGAVSLGAVVSLFLAYFLTLETGD